MKPILSVCCLLLICTVMAEAATKRAKRQPAAEAAATPKPDAESAEAGTTQAKTLDRGWGENIEWVQTYEEALAKARETKKPLMVIHHLEDCPFSQDLKKAFVADPLAQKLARDDFVMLNVVPFSGKEMSSKAFWEQNAFIVPVIKRRQHPVADDNQSPDGHYVPRVLFVDPSMTVRTDLAGRYSNRMYAYEAGDIPELVTNMKKARILLHTEL